MTDTLTSPTAANGSRIAFDADIGEQLEAKLGQLVKDVEQSDVYLALTDPNADPKLVTAILKHVYLSIAFYQPHVTEATFTAVGKMPKQSEQLIKDMILQQVEEVEHADMALRDYKALGGDPADADAPMPPACAAVAAMCHFLAEHQHPANYLGFMYIFEALTPIMAAKTQEVMARSSYKAEAREFIDLHATEDIRHTDMIVKAIEDLCEIIPEAAGHVLHGFDCFTAVYPVAIWNEALERAKAEVAGA
ncbi:MAG: iron-containing redox enzyme family protein [Planctomycetota bacterium]